MKQYLYLLLICLLCPLAVWSANKKTSVSTVSSEVTISTDVDYQITSTTPFTEDGLVNITNTENAVLIFTQIKPSVVISKWLSQVQINGAKAVNGRNCQVKLYNRGAIIMPHGDSFKPLTVYTEQRYQGESCNDYGTENSGGYMNTLTTAKLNNCIRSFKLKRGYMVTFSTRASGRGYSRCFIAASKDLEVPSLPAVLDQKITSYRIFKWYDTGKQQLAAAGGNNDACSALNVTSTYTWGTTSDMSPNVENVPHHIYENYPSPSSLGACTTSPHMKTNNEPMNTSDDPKGKTEDVDAVLANWEDLMATGMRLCSPSSWDGSDYTNGTGYIKRFIDSIDARGWRCDIIDLHCYWPESNFGTIKNWTNSTGRPVWVSEWVWGASWNSNGAFASNVTESQNAEVLKRICPVMNNNDCIERYYYWNGERDPSRLYKDGSLTEAGKYYASINSDLGYNGKYDFIPTTPPQHGPSKFTKKVLTSSGKTRLSWYDSNGEFNRLMEVQMKGSSGLWEVLDTITQKEAPSNYNYDINNTDESIQYRLHLIDMNGKEYYTSNDMELGDAFDIDGQIYYAGGNLFPNGEFDLGFTGWTNGTGKPLAEPQFQAVGDGGYGGGTYLQSHQTGGMSVAASIKTVVDLVPGEHYAFRIATRNGGNYTRFCLSADGSALTKEVAKAPVSTEWDANIFTFNADTYAKGILACYSLLAKAQIDGVQLRQLFPTREAAVADGIEKARLRAEAQKAYYTEYTVLNEDLSARIAAITGTDEAALAEIKTALAEHQTAIKKKKESKIIAATLKAIEQRPCPAYEQMLGLVHDIDEAQTAVELIAAANQLQALEAQYLSFARSTKQPRYPSFANEKSDGWQVKAGTYTGGDQRTATKFGKTCWNAWWSTTDNNATMEIYQTLNNLPEGYYRLECKATTEHFCISDQHCYLKSGDVVAESPIISKDYFDLPVTNVWDTLTTTPIFVEQGAPLTLGFVSSKNGAQKGKWHSFGNASGTSDNREGWWCATDFVLKYRAVDDETSLSEELRVKSEELGSGWYDLSGRKVNSQFSILNSQLKKGIYIKVEKGRAKKVTVK